MRRSTHPPKGTFSLDLHVLGTPPAFNLSQDQTLQLRVVSWLRFLIESQSDFFPEAAISRDLPDSLFNCQRTFPQPRHPGRRADLSVSRADVQPTPVIPESQHFFFSTRQLPFVRRRRGSFYPVRPSPSTPFFKSLPEPPPSRAERGIYPEPLAPSTPR